MIVSNGNFADPENPDSDGDGLLDGDEIIGTLRRDSYSINAPDEAVLFKYTFECVSDPNTEDTDGDGLLDGEDNYPSNYSNNHLIKKSEKESLKNKLLKQIKDDISFSTNMKSIYSPDKCVDIIFTNDKIITKIANKYQFPKAYIQSILLRELYCYGVDDPIGDLGFMNFCRYNQSIDFYYSQSEAYQSSVAPPKPPLILKKETSTGIGQITTKTALKAYNFAVDKGYMSVKKENTLKERESLFLELKNNDEFNIEMCVLVLMYGWYDNYDYIDDYIENYWLFNKEQKKTFFTIYNSGVTQITDYGEAVYNLYEIFKDY